MQENKGDKHQDPQGMQSVMLRIQQPFSSNSPFLTVFGVPVHSNTLIVKHRS
jgi:hypothetical protein